MDCEVDKLDGRRAVGLRGLAQGGNLILVAGNDKIVGRLYLQLIKEGGNSSTTRITKGASLPG